MKNKSIKKSIRDRSGNIESNDNLVLFLYLLMRDHVTAGFIEEIMRECNGCGNEQIHEYSNG